MTLVRSNNGYSSAVPSLISRLLSNDWSDWNDSDYSATRTSIPAVNISENDDEYQIEVAAPGMRKEDFKVKIENDTLTISSERKDENLDEQKGRYSRKEFSYQSFCRTFTLPENLVNSDKVHAKYVDGVLKLTLPKKEEAKPKPAREIKIA